MTALYYAAKTHAGEPYDFTGPVTTYDEAVQVHTRELCAAPLSFAADGSERRVLLDVSSVATCDEQEMMLLLMCDPMLHAVFTMGRRTGYEAAKEEGK